MAMAMEFTRQEQLDACIDLILAAGHQGTVKDGEAAEIRKKNRKKSARKDGEAAEIRKKNRKKSARKDGEAAEIRKKNRKKSARKDGEAAEIRKKNRKKSARKDGEAAEIRKKNRKKSARKDGEAAEIRKKNRKKSARKDGEAAEIRKKNRKKSARKDGEAAEIRKKNRKKSARKDGEATALEWARKSVDAERAKNRSGIKPKPKTMAKEDVAAAAVYRAQAEEARRNREPEEEFDALMKWIGTGDPEAIRTQNKWVDENMEAMKLEAPHPTEDCDVKRYREFGEFLWVDSFGSSPVQPMRYTYTDDEPPRGAAYPMRTLQVFSVRVAAIKGGLDWPLDVYGTVGARDSLDDKRNIIFDRTRDNCQIIDKKDIHVIHFKVNGLPSDYVKFMKARGKRSRLIAALKYRGVPVTPHRNPSCKEGDDNEQGEDEEQQGEEELNRERKKKKTGRSYHKIELYHSDVPSKGVQLLVCDYDAYTVGFRRKKRDGNWDRWLRLKGEHMPSWLNAEEIAIKGSHTKNTKIGGSDSIINMFYTLAREDRTLEEIREAILLAVLIFCEALRLYWIWQLIIKAIAGNINATPLESYYWDRINCWGQFSKLLLHLGKHGTVDTALPDRIMNKCGYSTIDDIIGPKGDLALLMRNDGILLDEATTMALDQHGAGADIEDPGFS